MEKPIISTTLSGLFIKSEPWKNAHVLWFEEMAERFNDDAMKDSVKKWVNLPNYFQGVDEVMKQLYPNMSDAERTERARETYFNSVLKYIKQNPEVKNWEVIKYFISLKEKYRIALITTNTINTVNEILILLEQEDLFDIIETSYPDEKDDKALVFDRFINQYGTPLVYIGGGRKDRYDYCKQRNIPRIFANFENAEDIPGVINVHNLDELKEEIEKLIN